MKIIKILLLTTIFIASAVNAKDTIIELEDNSRILGKWKVTAEAAALHKTKTPLNITWEFNKGGLLNTVATDSRNRTGSMNINVKYSIEEGAIKKQSQPGREKYETCKVVSLEGKDMVLHCKYLYYFLTKM